MASQTKKVIIQTFDQMLREQPFAKITVSAIVARCEISPNTFYYHYRDIYDLFDTWLQEQQEQFFVQTADAPNWSERLKRLLRMLQAQPRLVSNVFHSVSRDHLEHYIFTSVSETFYSQMKSLSAPFQLPESVVRAVSEFACYSMIGFFLHFMWEKMEIDVDASVDNLGIILNAVARQICADYGVQQIALP